MKYSEVFAILKRPKVDDVEAAQRAEVDSIRQELAPRREKTERCLTDIDIFVAKEALPFLAKVAQLERDSRSQLLIEQLQAAISSKPSELRGTLSELDRLEFRHLCGRTGQLDQNKKVGVTQEFSKRLTPGDVVGGWRSPIERIKQGLEEFANAKVRAGGVPQSIPVVFSDKHEEPQDDSWDPRFKVMVDEGKSPLEIALAAMREAELKELERMQRERDDKEKPKRRRPDFFRHYLRRVK